MNKLVNRFNAARLLKEALINPGGIYQAAQGGNANPPCFKISDLCHFQVIGFWGGASLCRTETLPESEFP